MGLSKSRRITALARAEESSQLLAHLLLFKGMLSVCPSTRSKRGLPSGTVASSSAIEAEISATAFLPAAVNSALPLAKRTSEGRTIRLLRLCDWEASLSCRSSDLI